MPPGLYMLLVGLSIGLATYSLLNWIAQKLRRDRPSPDSEQTARQLEVMALANLILTPLLMWLLYTFVFSND